MSLEFDLDPFAPLVTGYIEPPRGGLPIVDDVWWSYVVLPQHYDPAYWFTREEIERCGLMTTEGATSR